MSFMGGLRDQAHMVALLLPTPESIRGGVDPDAIRADEHSGANGSVWGKDGSKDILGIVHQALEMLGASRFIAEDEFELGPKEESGDVDSILGEEGCVYKKLNERRIALGDNEMVWLHPDHFRAKRSDFIQEVLPGQIAYHMLSHGCPLSGRIFVDRRGSMAAPPRRSTGPGDCPPGPLRLWDLIAHRFHAEGPLGESQTKNGHAPRSRRNGQNAG